MLRLSNAGRDYRWDTRADQARPTQGLRRCPQPSISSPPRPRPLFFPPPFRLVLSSLSPRAGSEERSAGSPPAQGPGSLSVAAS